MAGTVTILHVDADPDVRLIVDIALQIDPAVRVLTATDAESAVSVVRNCSPAVTGILVDSVLRDCDAIEFVRRVRAEPAGAAVPVIFLTTRTTPAEVAAMVAAGACGVLRKPFNPVTLAGDVCRLLGDARTV